MAAMLAILLVFVGWLFWSGPISLGFLTPVLRDALNMSVDGVHFDLDDTILTWAGGDRAVDIRVKGAKIFDNRGALLVGVPELSLGLSGLALLEGDVALTRLELIGPQIELERTAAGKISFGANFLEEADAGFLVEKLLRRLTNASSEYSHAEYFTSASIRDARLTIRDHLLDQTWQVDGANVVVAGGAKRLIGQGSLMFWLGETSFPLEIHAVHTQKGGETTIRVSATNIDLNNISNYHNSLSILEAFRGKVSAVLGMSLDNEGVLNNVDFDFQGSNISVRLPQYFDEDLFFERLTLGGHATERLSVVEIEKVNLHAGNTIAQLTGLVRLGDGLVGEIGGSFSNLLIDDLERYWPNAVFPKARDWVTTRVRSGVISQGNFRVNVPHGQFMTSIANDTTLEFTLDFTGASARYLSKMPKLVDASGSAHMSGNEVEVNIEAARIGNISLSEGKALIVGVRNLKKVASIGFVGMGQMTDILGVLDRKPYQFAKSIGLSPRTTSGLVAARVRFDFPLVDNLTVDEIQYAAAANIRDLSIPRILGSHQFRAGDLSVQIDSNGLEAEGTALINGVNAKLEWQRSFRPTGQASSRLSIFANLDDDERRRLGVPSALGVRGITPVSAQILTKGWDILEMLITANLTDASVDFPAIMWSKEIGGALNATFEAKSDEPNSELVTSFALSGSGLSATGKFEIDGGNVLRRLDLSLLELGNTRVSASVRPRAPEGFIVAVDGESFDMRPYLNRLFDSDSSLLIPPLVLSMRVGKIILSDDHSLSSGVGRAFYSGSKWVEMGATGILNGESSVEVALLAENGERRIKVDSDDAGAFLRSLGIFNNGIGGKLQLRAKVYERELENTIDGILSVNDFKVMNAPVLAKILTIGSLSGLANLLNGEGIYFVRFNAPFSVKNKYLKVRNARAVGPALGITLEGFLNRQEGEIKMEGTLVPSYTLNSVLGNIPVLGDLLIGKQGEGVFAINYSVSGPVVEPTIRVNPLTALAPGFLRTIVSGNADPGEASSLDLLQLGE